MGNVFKSVPSTRIHVIVVPRFWSVHSHVPTKSGVQLLCIPFDSTITSSGDGFRSRHQKRRFSQRAGGGYQPIQMASWPPVLPEPTSVRTLIEQTRKMAESTSLGIFTERTKKLIEPTSFRVFTERTKKLAEPTRLRILRTNEATVMASSNRKSEKQPF